jgi:hypothetical protein
MVSKWWAVKQNVNREILGKIERDLNRRRDLDIDLCVWTHGMKLLREKHQKLWHTD